MNIRFLLCIINFFFYLSPLFGKNVVYELKINRCSVNLSGKQIVDFALCINGSIPAPVLEFTEEDTAEIKVINELDEETSIHWHGILLPNDQDGVSYVTTTPINGKSEKTFRFTLRQPGTYWYHSHTGLQEQKGIYGAFIIHPKKQAVKVDKEFVAVLSDWIDENPNQVLKNLKKDGDYYRFKKGRVPSIIDAWQQNSLADYFNSEWTRMGAMDLADIAYDRFLINGKPLDKIDLRPGEKLRLRVINSAASSYFYLQLGQRPFTIIAADGIDIKPVSTKEILIGMAETYDLLIVGEKDKSIEFRAMCQDISGFASLQIGSGELESPISKPLPSLYKMQHQGAGNHSLHEGMNHKASDTIGIDHSKMDHSKTKHEMTEHLPAVSQLDKISDMLSYDLLIPLEPQKYSSSQPLHEIKFKLKGDMERYTWELESEDLKERKSIYVKEGEIVRFELENETMMHHPMHLHGHFFKVLGANSSSDTTHAPLKHTVDVPPHSSQIIEFYANEPGHWLFHCHNLYHMKAGMDGIVRYETFTPAPDLQKIAHHDPHQHEHWYQFGRIDAFTDEAKLYLRTSNSKWQVDGESTYYFNKIISEDDEKLIHEGDLKIHRWFGPYTNLFAGAYHTNKKITPLTGFYYLLPLRIESQLSFDSIRKLNLKLSKELPISSSIETELSFEWNKEEGLQSEAMLMYRFNWNFMVGLKFASQHLSVGLTHLF